jgi:hypothetical protein
MGDEETLFKKKGKKGKRRLMAAEGATLNGSANHPSGLISPHFLPSHPFWCFLFCPFFFGKKLCGDRDKEEELTDFSTFKTGLVQPSNCIIYYET